MIVKSLTQAMLIAVVAAFIATLGAIVWRELTAPVKETQPQSCVIVLGDTVERYVATCHVVRERER